VSGRAAASGALAAFALVAATGCARTDPAAEHAALVRRGHDVFFARCGPCHGPQGDWPIVDRLGGRTADDFYRLFDRLPSVNPIMPRFDDAPETDKRAAAAYLASLKAGRWDDAATAPPSPQGTEAP
jgi:mono/diheme cytochrome c family protein